MQAPHARVGLSPLQSVQVGVEVTLGPTDPGTRVAIGLPGMGKSHSIRTGVLASAGAGVPIIVVDPMHEWESVPASLVDVTHRVRTVAKAIERLEQGKRLVIVSPDEDIVTAADEACEWTLARKRTDNLRGVAIHEAWMVAPSSGVKAPGVVKVARAWRHRRVLAWFDAQRIANISRDLTEIATELRLFGAAGDLDFTALKGFGTRELVDRVKECGDRGDAGEVGWHVCLPPRRGPYVPVRLPPP